MLKRSSLRRIVVATTALLILGILYLFPTKEKKEEIPKSIEYTNIEKSAIYLLDQEHFVARTGMILKENEPLEKAKEIIEALTIGGKKKDYIPSGFYPIIPKGTTLKNISLENGTLKIDFSKEILNITENEEESLLEALIYSLTEIKEVQNISLFVEGDQLAKLPHTSKRIPPILDRSYGINKMYDIDHIDGTSKTTIYYLNKTEYQPYYVPVTKITNTDKEHVEVIIESLKSAPIYETNLMSYLQASAKLKNYTLLEDSISLSFNEFILSDLNDRTIQEEVKYSIALSLKDSYQINSVIFEVNDEQIDVVTDI